MLNAVKQKSVNYILGKYETEPEHAMRVRKLALKLFDITKGNLHNFSNEERSLLEAGALLHDIGYYISANEHNKHSARLIREERPSGFTDEEILIVSCIARYHRGKKPKDKHENYAALSETAKKLTRKLSALCRLADALDCSHQSVVEEMDCIYNSFSKDFFIVLKFNMPDCSVEISKARDKKDMFEEEFNVEVKFRIE